MKKTSITFLIIIFLFNFTTISLAINNYMWSTIETSAEVTSGTPVAEENNNSLGLECGSAILIEQKTGQILYSHNVHEQLRPASVTKVMSILLIMEQIEKGNITYETKIPCSNKAAGMGGSQIWLNTTETLSVNDMLKAICVASANDCVMAMAEYIGGSEEGFVELMNAKAKELGMNDTTFKNCHGLDEDGHVTSSNDIALMSRELLNKYPEITKYTTIYMDTLRDGKSELVNTNKLVRNYEGCTGLKTGSTSLALYNLSASATRNDLSLIAVIMKAPTSQKRFEEAEKLLNYGFSKFEYKEFAKAGDKLKSCDVAKGITSKVDAVFEKDIGVLIEKGKSNNISQTITLNEELAAPISKGEKIGEVVYSLNDQTLITADLISKEEIKKLNMFSMSAKVYEKWLNLLR
ncbi:MAG: D-alanyl-D-alanine carboxypeptidase [Clostridia bacterium]|nr:D-alanyl-D-alanine carboxypeptidase [Clostridia bacterium]